MDRNYLKLQDNIMKKLRRKCENDPQYQLLAAYLLNYRSSLTVDQWLRRGRIPSHKLIELKGVLDGKITVTVK